MISATLTRLVKWTDDAGGWHTGKVVEGASIDVDRLTAGKEGVIYALVQESCNGALTWVENGRLTDYVGRPNGE